MRQVDGSDLLGQGDPRNADIGIIYVEAEDSRQEILTAINAQELLGRKQIAIVLPEQGKAFRQPVEFDGLKNMRRGLKAQLIFIASPGPGPAEFARQRRFVVYSSTEGFRTALLSERPLNPRAQSASVEGKKPGLLGRGRMNKGRDQNSPAAPDVPPTPRIFPGLPPVVMPMTPLVSPQSGGPVSPLPTPRITPAASMQPIMPPTPPTPQVSPQAPGPVVPVPVPLPLPGIGQPISPMPAFEDENTRTLDFETPNAPPPGKSPGALRSAAFGSDDDLPPPPATPRQPGRGAPDDYPTGPARSVASGRAPTPIRLSMSPSISKAASDKVPAVTSEGSETRSGSNKPAVSGRGGPQGRGTKQLNNSPVGPGVSDQPRQPNGKNGGTDKIPVVLPMPMPIPMSAASTGPGAAVPAMSGGPLSSSANAAATTVAASSMTPGTPGIAQRQVGLTPLPPPVSRRSRNRGRRRLLLAALLILITLLVGGLIVNALGGLNGLTSLGHLSATVTLTPRSQLVQNNYLLTGVLSPAVPDAAHHEIAARQLDPQVSAKQANGQATGSVGGAKAHGILTFQNVGTSTVTLGTTTLTATGGVQIQFFGPVIVPAGGSTTATTTAYAVKDGTAGNVGTFAIDGQCCAANIFVKNTAPFVGGADPYPAVTQNDVATAAAPLLTQIKGGMPAALKKQVKSGEQIVNDSLQCQAPTMNSTPAVSVPDPGGTFTVNVSLSCTEEVFDLTGAQQLARGLLPTDPPKGLDLAGYQLVGQVLTTLQSASIVSGLGQVSVEMQAIGKWVYRFDNQKQLKIKQTLVGLSKAAAQTVFATYPGVLAANIDISSGSTLPKDINAIMLTLASVPGLAPGTPISNGTGTPSFVVTPASSPTPCPSQSPTPQLSGGNC